MALQPEEFCQGNYCFTFSPLENSGNNTDQRHTGFHQNADLTRLDLEVKLMTTDNAWQGLQCCDSELPTYLTVYRHVFSLLVEACSFARSSYAYSVLHTYNSYASFLSCHIPLAVYINKIPEVLYVHTLHTTVCLGMINILYLPQVCM